MFSFISTYKMKFKTDKVIFLNYYFVFSIKYIIVVNKVTTTVLESLNIAKICAYIFNTYKSSK